MRRLLLTLLALVSNTATAEDQLGKLRVFPSENELVLRNFEDGTYK